MPASSNAQTKQKLENDADKDNAEIGTIASSNAQKNKKKKPFPMPSWLHRYTFLQCSIFLFLDEPSSLFILHKSPQSSQNSSSASFSISLTEIIMVFSFFLGVKNSCRALHCHRAMVAPFFFFSFFSSLFFFFLVVKKKFPRSSHCWKEIFAWNYLEHWCEFNIWQNVMVEASTMVIWCCESVMFLFFL